MGSIEDSPTRVDRLFHAARERPARERVDYLRAACRGDADLLREVTSLLAAADEMDEEFLETSILGMDESPRDLGPGSRIGVYRISREIGRGGMGRVYLAFRDDEVYQQKVAIKVLKRGLDSDEIVRRFQHERRLLARLDHPYIVRILDGGTTDAGLPYLVMEYVEGEPIDRYCKRRDLSLRQRLKLFRAVCSAVTFAHQNLVVHRDLKPQNILVDGRGEPKLLDFGIAKVLDSDSAALTRVGARLMTPAYASPEQLAGGPVTTVSDVYSLGRLFHLLVTGHLPKHFPAPANPLRPGPILPLDPEPPSRCSEIGRLDRDIDSIALQAQEIDPERRYASVEQLSDDVERYLHGLPVRARPATPLYQLGKFVRRHFLGATVATVALVCLLAFGVGMTILRADAERERHRAQEAIGLLEDLLSRPDPEISRAPDTTLRQFLDQSADRVRGDSQIEPEVRADLLHIMGRAYLGMDLYDDALPLLTESLRLLREDSQTPQEDLAATLSDLAEARLGRDEHEKAEELLREALQLLRRAGSDDRLLARALNNHALVLKEMGRLDLAEAPLRESLELRVRLLGENHPDVATGRHNLGAALRELGRLDEAEELYRKSLTTKIETFGHDSLEAAGTLNSLGLVHLDRGEPEAAERRFRRVVEIRLRVYGTEHPAVASALTNLGAALRTLGEYSEAEARFAEAKRILTLRSGTTHSSIADVLMHQALLRLAEGRFDEAEALAREALVMQRATRPPRHWRIAEATSVLGACLDALGRTEEAAPLLRTGYEALEAQKGQSARQTREARARLEASGATQG